jgi:hypothetical protein
VIGGQKEEFIFTNNNERSKLEMRAKNDEPRRAMIAGCFDERQLDERT